MMHLYRELLDYQTVDEYKAGIRADLLAQKQKNSRSGNGTGCSSGWD